MTTLAYKEVNLGDGFILVERNFSNMLAGPHFELFHEGLRIGVINEDYTGNVTYTINHGDLYKASLHLDKAAQALNYIRGLKRLTD